MIKSETAWKQFISEVVKYGYVWSIEKSGEFARHKNRYGRYSFPIWSSREKTIRQITNVSAYNGYTQIGYELKVFVDEWVPILNESKCMLAINCRGVNNVGFDLEIEEVISAIYKCG